MTGFHFRFRLIWLFYTLTVAGLVFAYAVAPHPQRDRDAVATQRHLNRLVNELYLYERHIGEFPTSQQGLAALLTAPVGLSDRTRWHGPYERTGPPIDAWSRPFNYERQDYGFRVWSNGPDGRFGTDDDLEYVRDARRIQPTPVD